MYKDTKAEQKPKYVKGSFKVKNGKFGEFFSMSLNVDELKQYADEKGYVRLTIKQKREPNDFGTHTVVIDEWRPSKPGYSNEKIDPNDLPF